MGLYQFTVMPFGLSSAPAMFQWMMDQTLIGMEEFVGVYLDNVVIHSMSWREDLHHLGQLQHAGLTVKLKKCNFGTSECTYLRYRISRDGIKPEASKIQAIHKTNRPQTKKDIQTFLGLTGHRDNSSGTMWLSLSHWPDWWGKTNQT